MEQQALVSVCINTRTHTHAHYIHICICTYNYVHTYIHAHAHLHQCFAGVGVDEGAAGNDMEQQALVSFSAQDGLARVEGLERRDAAVSCVAVCCCIVLLQCVTVC